MFLRRLQTHLMFSHALIVAVLIPILGFLLIYLLETQYLLAVLANQLVDQATLISDFTQSDPKVWVNQTDASEVINRLKQHIDPRIMLLNKDGYLLSSSLSTDSHRVGQLMSFPAVQSAIHGQSSWQVDYNSFMSARIVDMAMPVKDTSGNTIGIVRLSYDITSIEQQILPLRGLVIIALLIGTILALILAFVLGRSLSQPLFRVAEVVTKLLPGTPPIPLPETGPEELRVVARSYNKMALRLYTLEMGRRQFLATIVHELATPLAAVKAAAQTLQNGATADEALAVDLAAGIENQVDQLHLLIDDLTLLGETEMRALILNRHWLNLEELIQSQCLAYAYLVKQKQIELTYQIKGELPQVWADDVRLRQVMANLLNNAFKYTPASGKITVSASAETDVHDQVWTVLQISDTGPGIAPEEQEKIFDVLYRSPRQRNLHKGMGLGLPLARRLAEAHGGTLILAKQPKQGAVFILRLPVGGNNTPMPIQVPSHVHNAVEPISAIVLPGEIAPQFQ